MKGTSFIIQLVFFILVIVGFISCNDDDMDIDYMNENHDMHSMPVDNEEQIEENTRVEKVQYTPPSTNGLEFVELFDDNEVFQRWTLSKSEHFVGVWKQTERHMEVFDSDKGLKLSEPTKHYAISTKISDHEFLNNLNKNLAISYQLKYDEEPICGGSYFKLFHQDKLQKPSDYTSFDNLTPYVVMFGPDFCGSSNKVHFIIKTQNPNNKEWTEHHLINPPTVKTDLFSHVYGFHITADNQFSIYIDGKVQKHGNMLTSFDPPFELPKTIEDPNDTEPEDWPKDEMVPDPNDLKPEDWNEDEPITIIDPEAKKPEDWLEDEPIFIQDPDDVMPEDWDEQEQGVWEPKKIPNPACKEVSGCGYWKPPLISNPNYKGTWKQKMIRNPNYKGKYVPKQIPNPNYYKVENPHALAPFTSIGIEVWSVHAGTVFDNIVISRDINKIQKFVKETWEKRKEQESKKRMLPESNNNENPFKENNEGLDFKQILISKAMFYISLSTVWIQKNPLIAVAITTILIVLSMLMVKNQSSSKPQTIDTISPSHKVSTSKPASEQSTTTEKTDSSDKDEPQVKQKASRKSPRKRENTVTKDD